MFFNKNGWNWKYGKRLNIKETGKVVGKQSKSISSFFVCLCVGWINGKEMEMENENIFFEFSFGNKNNVKKLGSELRNNVNVIKKYWKLIRHK